MIVLCTQKFRFIVCFCKGGPAEHNKKPPGFCNTGTFGRAQQVGQFSPQSFKESYVTSGKPPDFCNQAQTSRNMFPRHRIYHETCLRDIGNIAKRVSEISFFVAKLAPARKAHREAIQKYQAAGPDRGSKPLRKRTPSVKLNPGIAI